MRHVFCQVFNVVAILSLLLCVATLALLVNVNAPARLFSAEKYSGVLGETSMRIIHVTYFAGRVELAADIDRRPTEFGPELNMGWQFEFAKVYTTPPWHRGHFYHQGNLWTATILFPIWRLSAALSIIPLARYGLVIRERRRAAKGLCASCGYDLRATPDRCPECGRAAIS
jgi:hypothetical protein